MAIVFVNNSVVNSAGESKVKRRSKKSSVKASMDPRIKSGRWTDAERRIFLKGLKQLWVAYIYSFLNGLYINMLLMLRSLTASFHFFATCNDTAARANGER